MYYDISTSTHQSCPFFYQKNVFEAKYHEIYDIATAFKTHAAVSDYFIHGHGVQANTSFIVPRDVSIRFYAKEGKLFDDIWMKTIREGSPPPKFSRFTDFERSEFSSGETCPNYNLMYPTGLCIDFSVDEQTDITSEMSISPTKNNLIMPLGEGNPIKKPTTATCTLDWIITELQKKHFGKITLHWCACREESHMSLHEWVQNQIAKGPLRKRITW